MNRNDEKSLRRVFFVSLTDSKPVEIRIQIEQLQCNSH